MGDLSNVTLNGTPLDDVLRDEHRREVEAHCISEQIEVRRRIARGRNILLPRACQKRGRKPREISIWVVDEIARLAQDEWRTKEQIAKDSGQPLTVVRVVLSRLGKLGKRGRKKQARSVSDAAPKA